MKSLIDGIKHFQRRVFPEYQERFEHLATGQNPDILLITCSDSRVNPSLLTQTDPGSLFQIRNAGNIVPPYKTGGGAVASIEYAVRVLGIRNVFVCGHTDCGAMKGLLKPDGLSELPAVEKWLEIAHAARERLKKLPPDADDAVKLRAVIEENVRIQLENLKTHPSIAEGIKDGNIHLLGAVYAIETGEFFLHCPKRGAFVALDDVEASELLPDEGIGC